MSSQSNAPGGYGPLSPTSTRAPGRRRETSESYPFPQNPLSSPTGGFGREEQRAASPPPSLQRRRTDLKDGNKSSERESDLDDKAAQTPFGSLKRTTTGPLTSGFGAPSSPWANAPPSAGLSPMGSFGNFGIGQQGSQSDKRPGLGSGRAESRFKNLLSKDATEDAVARSVERKTSLSSLARVNENESWRPQQSQDGPPDELEEEMPSGSAALAADADLSPPQMRQGGFRGFGTPNRSESRDEFGFGAFGMTSDNAHAFGQAFPHQTPGNLRHMPSGNEPMSPTDTNPYQSPEQRGIDLLTEGMEGDGSDLQGNQLPGLGGFGGEQAQPFGGLGGFAALPNLGRIAGGGPGSSDRSQTSSAGANRGFPGLGGLGPLGGMPGAAAWPVTQGGLGTPNRQHAGISGAFGGGIFATSTADMQSSALAGLGGGNMISPLGGIGTSRMASMFPPAMQDQMRQGEQDRDIGSDRNMQQQIPGPGDYSRVGNFSSGMGDLQSAFTEQEQPNEQQGPPFGAPGPANQNQSSPQHVQSQSQSHIPSSQTPNQPPPPQQRTMVMPDRMRWIYRDPQGQTQGPWSGLEMHDWYKAGFFSPELLVKKYEDPEYEPLAQLIRRIGNSREPFLVPQIGIPHGAPSSSGPNAWAGSSPGSATATGAQPPFASSFPSFGTTLTADQQNALERRKQEEQYLMARQKEHLAQQQIAARLQHPVPHGASATHGNLMTGGGQLQHHSSAQSLHSQPSFGSVTSPTTGPFQASPIQGPQGHQPGFFDHSFRGPSQTGAMGAVGAGVDNLGHIREEEIPGIMDRLNLGARGGPGQFGAPGQPFAGQNQMQSNTGQEQQHQQQVQQMLHDRARLQQEQILHDAAQASGAEQVASNDRLQQFQQLQGQTSLPGVDARFQPVPTSDQQSSAVQSSIGSPSAAYPQDQPPQPQELTLTEQVREAASVQQSPVQPQFGLPQPFPPAPSQSPLPAPSAQRHGRQSVADQLQTEERELSQTPSVDTPSAAVAPWAKETVEAQKGPSLKEIQEMEAKKAAEAEALAAAARRAAFEKEMEAQVQSQAQAPAPGLPASASWGASGSPSTPTGTSASAWAKAAQKSAAPVPAKSMAQIQKEEEARKKKVAAAAANAQATAMSGVASPVGGKSYANLAGKVAAPPGVPNVGGAWTTVGAGGKPKTPAAVPAPPAARTVSSGTLPTMQANATAARKAPTRSSTTTSAGNVNAHEEFRKWAVGELRPDLNKGISGKAPSLNKAFIPISNCVYSRRIHIQPHPPPHGSGHAHGSRPQRLQHDRLAPLRRGIHPAEETRRQGAGRLYRAAQEREPAE